MIDKVSVHALPPAPRPRPEDRGRAPCFPSSRMAGPCSIPGHLAVSRRGCMSGEAHSVPNAIALTLNL